MRLRATIIFGVIAAALMSGCTNTRKSTGDVAVDAEELTNQQEVQLMTKFLNANRQKILENENEAIVEFQECLEIDPTNAAVHYELARLYSGMGRLFEAEASIEKAVKEEPGNVWFLLTKAGVYEQQGRFSDAADVFEQLFESNPSRTEFAYRQANALISANKLKAAIHVYDDLEQKLGASEELAIQKQRLHERKGDINSAIEEIENLVSQFPKNVRYRGLLANLYQRAGRSEEAIQTFEKALTLEPNNANIQLSLAEYYDNIGEKEKSFDFVKKAFGNPGLSIDTKIQLILQMLESARVNSNVQREALEVTKIVQDTHPDSPKAHAVRGDVLYQAGDLKEAALAYRASIDKDPSRFVVWNQLLIIDSELGEQARMEEDATEAVKLFPAQPSFYFFKGIAQLGVDKPDSAIATLETGLQLVYGNPFLSSQMLASLGDAYNETEQFSKSDSAYEAALTFDPNNDYVLNNYSYFLSLRGEKLEQAKSMSFTTIERNPNNASYLDTYGWILYKLGEYESAATYLKNALNNGGDNSAEVLEHYGDVLFSLGQEEAAHTYWKRALDAGGDPEKLNPKIATGKLE